MLSYVTVPNCFMLNNQKGEIPQLNIWNKINQPASCVAIVSETLNRGFSGE